MTIQYICDRCKGVFPEDQLVWYAWSGDVNPMDTSDVEGDFCSSCVDAIRAFIRGEWNCPKSHSRDAQDDGIKRIRELIQESERQRHEAPIVRAEKSMRAEPV